MAVFTPIFGEYTWILALFPPILTIRGGIGGIFSGNLATMMHLGLVKPRIRGNTEHYMGLIKSVLVITGIDTLILGSFSFMVNVLFGSAELSQLFLFLCVPTVTCVLAVSISIPMTSLIAIETYKRGLDPDIIVYPILASLNDIVVTSFFVLNVFLVLRGGIYYSALIMVFLLILTALGVLAITTREDEFFRQTLREGTYVVVMSSIFGGVNGVLLSNIASRIIATPGLMVLYPSLTNTLGNIGSILGSKTTTDIALGVERSSETSHWKDITRIEVPAFIIHIIFAVLSYILTTRSGANLWELVSIATSCNLLSFMIITSFAFWIAPLAHRNGLNPDNVVIPTITSVSDTIATLAITPAIIITKLLLL